MADQNAQADVAEAADDDIDPLSGAEALDDGTATESASEQLPDLNLQGLSNEEMDALEAAIMTGKPAANASNQDDDSAEEDAEDTTEATAPEEHAEADFSKVKRIQVSHHKPEDRKRMVQINDLIRGGLTFEEAVARVAPKVATKSPEAETSNTESTPAQTTETQAHTGLASANDALEAAETALQEAQASYDADAIRVAQKAVNAANREVARQEWKAEQAQSQLEQAAGAHIEQEHAALRAAVPEMGEAGELLETFNDLIASLPDKMVGPGKAMDVARMAWAKTYPDKPFPGDGKSARAEVVRPPNKNGTPVAALGATTRNGQPKIMAALRTPGAERQLTDADLDAVLAGMP